MDLPRLTRGEYTVALICPMGHEFAPLMAMLDKKHQSLQTIRDQNSYTLGSMAGHNVVIATMPETGTHKAATVATQLLNDFPSIRFGLLVGIGGGIPTANVDIRLGDVVVSKPTGNFGGVVQFDRGKTLSDGKLMRTGSLAKPPSVLSAHVSQLSGMQEADGNQIKKYLSKLNPRMKKRGYTYQGLQQDLLFPANYTHPDEETCEKCDLTKLIKRDPRDDDDIPEIHYGTIGSSNSVIKDGEFRDKLRKELGIICVEMEAAGLMDDFPCLVIRGICDYAGTHKNDRWQRYAAATAAAYANELLSTIPSAEMAAAPVAIQDECLRSLLLQDSRTRTNGPKAEGETCKWIENRPEFRKWMTTDRSMILLVSGKHGCGKSVLAKHVREHMVNHVRESVKTKKPGTQVLASFFNDRGGNATQVALRTIRSLLYQVFSHNRQLMNQVPLLKYYVELKQSGKEEVEWPLDDLATLLLLLRSVEGGFTFYLIIDSVDEARSEQIPIVSELLKLLVSEESLCKFKIFLTTRTSSTKVINSLASSKPVISLDASKGINDVIKSHISKQLDLLSECYSKEGYPDNYLNEHLKPMIDQLSNQSKGSFLWVNLELIRLKEEQSSGTPVVDLVRGSDKLSEEMEEHYRNVLKPFEGEHARTRRIMLQWVLFAERPLTEKEFRIAVTINRNYEAYSAEKRLFDEVRSKTFQRQVEHHCGGFLEITEPQVEITERQGKTPDRKSEELYAESSSESAVQLTHHSAGKYLRDNRRAWFFHKGHRFGEENLSHIEDLAHYDLARTCLTYIASHSEGLTEESVLSEEYEKLFKGRCFLKYAALYWTRHLDMIDMTSERIAFFQPKVQDLARSAPTAMLCCRVSRLERHLDFSAAVELHHIVSELGHKKVLEMLLKNGEKAGAKDNHGRSQLSLAARNGHKETLDLLLRRGFEADARDGYGRTPLSSAARNGHKPVVELLQSRPDIDVNSEDKDHWTPLSLAAMYGHEGAVDELLKSPRIDLDLECNGRSPLYIAAQNGREKIAQKLAETGDKTLRIMRVQKLLHQAVEEGNREAAELLLKIRANTGTTDKEDQTSLCIAFQKGHEEIMRLLLENGVNKEVKDDNGQTFLHRAVSERKQRVAELLIAFGADKDAKDDSEQTPLHKAMDGDVKDVELLLGNGAQMNVKDKNGKTPLHSAVSNEADKSAIVELLIRQGADTTMRDKNGQTLLHAAASKGTAEMVSMILKHKGPGINARDRDGRTPLHVAAINGNIEAADILINQKADLEMKDKDQQTPLHTAVRWKNSAMAELLVFKGAKLKARDYKFQTAADLAERSRNIAAIPALRGSKVIIPSQTYAQRYLLARRMTKNFRFGRTLNSESTRKRAQIATHNAEKVADMWNAGKHIVGLTKLALYDIVILCDNSGSMKKDNRWESLMATLKRVAQFALELNPTGISLRFLNGADKGKELDHLTAENIETKVKDVEISGLTKLGTELKKRILEPMVYQMARTRDKPLLVVIITDGQATDGSALQDAILECKRWIVKEWGDGAVLFLISRIGDDRGAVKFLKSLEMKVEIEDIVYCSKKKLDDLVASGEHKNIAGLIGLFSAALGEPNQELEPQPEASQELETSQDVQLETQQEASQELEPQLEMQQETEPEGAPEAKPEKDPETKPDRSPEKLEGGLEAKPEKDPETKLDRNLDRKSDKSPQKPEESLEKLAEKLAEKAEGDSGIPVGRLDKLGGYGKVRSPRASPPASRAASPSPGVAAGMENISKIDDIITLTPKKSQDTQLETQQETKPERGPEAKPEKDPETRSDRNLDQKSDGSPEKPEESLEKLDKKPEGDSGGGWLREGNIKGSDGEAADKDGQTPLYDLSHKSDPRGTVGTYNTRTGGHTAALPLNYK